MSLPGRALRRLTSTPQLYESSPVYPPTGDAVAFIRGALHADDLLWITDLDGRERALTPSGGYLMNVVWSPNGQRLAFTDTARSLFVVGRDGTGLRRVGAIREGSLLGWERAGILIGLLEQNRFRIRALDPANGRLQPLRNPCGDSNPTFSTDRRFVVCHGRSATVVRIRGRNGKLVRTVRVGARNQHTRIGRYALGPRGRPFIYDAMLDERHADLWLHGERSQRLTGGPLEDHDPAISPDRKSVVFVRSAYQRRRGNGLLMGLDLRTRRVRPLRSGLSGESPSWSPDGERLAFTSGSVYTVGAKGGGLRRLTDRSGHPRETSAAWSRDGRLIAFVRHENGRSTIRTVPANGGAAKMVYSVRRGDLVDLAWSPDSGSIAFSDLSAVKVLSLRTGETRELVREEDNRLHSPTWSPNGKTIAYASGWENDIPWTRPDAHLLQIWAVDVATGRRTRVVADSAFNFAPDWR